MGAEHEPTRWEKAKEKVKCFWENKAKPFVKENWPFMAGFAGGFVVGAIVSYLNLTNTDESDDGQSLFSNGSDMLSIFPPSFDEEEHTPLNDISREESSNSIPPEKEEPICFRCGGLMTNPWWSRRMYHCDKCNMYGEYDENGHFI